MRRFIAMLGAAVLATVIGSAGFALATHTSQVETHVIPWTIGGQTGAVTIQDTDVLPHETVTVTESVTVTVTEGEPPPPDPEPPPSSNRPWASDSPINTLIPSNPQVVVDYNQGVFVGLPDSIGFNGGGWGVAVFRDTSGARRTLTNQDGWKLDNVPEPAQFKAYWDAMNAIGDSEKHMVVIDAATGRVHNVYGTNRAFTTFYSAGEFRAVDVSSGFWDNRLGPWCGRASGFSSATGAVLKSELDAGVIDHALAVAFPKNRIGSAAVSPASTSDGSAGGGGIPMGSRIQLDPSLTDAQLLAMGIPEYYLPVAHAMQRYGAYVADSSSRMTIYAESWNDNGRVNWPGGWYPASQNLVKHLRVVAPPPTPDFDDRTVFNQPHR